MVIYTSNDIHPKGRGLGIDKSLPSHRRGLGQEFEGWLGSRLTDCSLEERVDNTLDTGIRLRFEEPSSPAVSRRLGGDPTPAITPAHAFAFVHPSQGANWASVVSTST